MDQQIKEYQTYFNELKINYDVNNVPDCKQLIFILDELDYPSTKRAILHMQSNRLGKLDLKDKQKTKNKRKRKKKQKKQVKNEDKPAAPMISTGRLCQPKINQNQIKSARHCACCGLLRQTQKLSILTHFSDIENLGVAIRLFFIAYQHVLVLMLSMFFVYALYAIISNVIACGYSQENLGAQFKNASYFQLVSDWIFATSLHANIACRGQKSFSYEVQCWLGVILMIIYFVIIAALRFRKILIFSRLQQKSKSIADLSILINNLPLNMQKAQLESQLRAYQQKITNKNTEQSKKIIKIAKINRAAPYYLSLSTFKGKQIQQVQKDFDQARERLVNLIKERRNRNTFRLNDGQRKQVYKKFQQAKHERVQTYKRIAFANILKQNQNKIITSPAFVTFQSSYNRDFLLDTYSRTKNIFSSDDRFQFNVYSKNRKLIKKIKASFQAAPRPEQIIWTNLGQSKRSMIKKKIFIAVINILFLLICFGVTFGLQLYDFNYALQNDGDPSSLGITISVTLIIVVISYVISYVLTKLTARQRNITVMHEQKSLQHKYVQSCIANYLIAPLIFSLVYKPQFQGIAPLSTTVFILSIDNAFFFPLLGVLDPLYFFNRLCKWYYNRPQKKLYQNQRQLNSNSQYLQFSVGLQFAYAINSFIFTCFYAPLQPIIVVFSIIGIFLMYWIQKHILFNRCCRPVPGNRIVNISTHLYLVFGPISFGIGCLVWPYYIKHQFIGLGPTIIIIVLSVIICLTPFDRLSDMVLKFLEDRGFSMGQYQAKQKIYSQMKKSFKYDYQRLNYMTAKEAMKRYVYDNFLKQIMVNNKQIKQLKEMDVVSNARTQITQRSQFDEDVKHKNIDNIVIPYILLNNKTKTNINVNNYNRLKSLSTMNKNLDQLPPSQDLSTQKLQPHLYYNPPHPSLHNSNPTPTLHPSPSLHPAQSLHNSTSTLHPPNIFLSQSQRYKQSHCPKQCKQQKDNYDFYYNYNDDDQILVHQVLEHLREMLMNKGSIIDDNYTDVEEAYQDSRKGDVGSVQNTW